MRPIAAALAAAAVLSSTAAPARAYPWDPDVAAGCWFAGDAAFGVARYTGGREIRDLAFVCRVFTMDAEREIPGATVGPVSVAASTIPDDVTRVCSHAVVTYPDGTTGEAQPYCWPPPF